MQKKQNIELLRVLGAFGVVWFHAGSVGKDIAYSGLIVFLVLSLYLAAYSSAGPKGALARAQRLLVPWLIWFMFYGAINFATHKPFFFPGKGIVLGILVGPRTHLWFMPFLFTALIIFDRLKGRISPRAIGYSCAALSLLVFITAAGWRPWSLKLGPPIAQYLHAGNGIFLGIFLGYFRLLAGPKRVVFLVAILALTAYLAVRALPGVGIPYFLGTSVSAIFLLSNPPFLQRINLTWLSQCSFGIYLIHPFFLSLAEKIRFTSQAGVPIAVFTASALAIFLLRRFAPAVARYVA